MTGINRANDRVPIIAGTFLICLSLLAFEISTVRTINFAIGPSFIFIAIALAMLGLTAAGSILSTVDLNAIRIRREYVLGGLCFGIAALLVLTNVLVVETKSDLNAAVKAAGEAGGLGRIVVVLTFQGAISALQVGLFLSFPYFLFGALLSYLFATSESAEYAKLYAADLIGAAVGCVAIVVLMETTGYAFSVTAPAVTAVLAAAVFLSGTRVALTVVTAGIALVLALLPQFAGFRDLVEPQAEPNHLARDYNYRDNIAEVWRGWNSYTRVGAVEWTDGSRGHAILSLANGDGLAYLWPFDPDRETPLVHKPAIPAMLLGPADDVLVLLAGAGADLMSLKENGAKRVTGIELNPDMLEAGLALEDYRLADFLKTDGVRLEIAEARAWLENDPGRYDVVLVSWSGATAVYYLGALSGTTEHIYTYEGLSAILDHLKPGGHAIALQVNKVNILAALRRYLVEQGITTDPERTAIVFYRDGHINSWDGHWDDNPLLIKLEGWTDEEVARIVENGRPHGLKVAYAPGLPGDPEYAVYERILTAPDIDAALEELRRETGLRFNIVTDDRPFTLDLFDNARYLTSDFWLGVPDGHLNVPESFHLMRVVITFLVGAAAFFLALAPLAFKRGSTPRQRSLGFLAYFTCLGAGFMFIEIAVIQRVGILYGNPGLTIAIVLCAIILFTGIGSLISNWSFRKGLSFRPVAAAVVVYGVLAGLFLEDISQAVIGWSLIAKVLVTFAVIAPGALLMGHLFPQGMALAGREDKALVPWAWAINGAMSATVAGFAPLVAQAFGFQALFLIGAALYAGIFLIPAFRARATPAATLAPAGP